MLTPELVRARITQGQLQLTRLSAKSEARALELAEQYLELAREHIGCVRDELKQAWALVAATPAERRLAEGLMKLVEDCCEFDAELELPPAELRREVFLEASAARKACRPEEPFDREQLLLRVAERHAVTPDVLEAALYADLKGAQKLQRVGTLGAQTLITRYQLGQVQAVLLRAVSVVAQVRCQSPLEYRQLFNKLKFRRLLYSIEPTADGYKIHLDGPFSLFESVTKYGLQLALVLPALLECHKLELTAELAWGKQRKRVSFGYEHQGSGAQPERQLLTDDVEKLRAQLVEKPSSWKITPSTEILNLPGLGVCVPDLVFEKRGRRIYLEVLGYWSREAVWRRVEMVESGLGAQILFAVSSRLRVSEAVLEASEKAALYVYKGVMSPAQVLKRVDSLANR